MPRRFDAIIFDMDGTIIDSSIDFAAIRAELGVPANVGILESIDAMDEPARSEAHRKLLAMEMASVASATLMPHARETLECICSAGLKTALLTRNAREAMERILQRFELEFDLAWSRERGPIKPEPDGVLRACEQLDVEPARTPCVGDYRYDLVAARSAGAPAVLLACNERPAFADEADYVIAGLDALPALLGIEKQ